MKCSNIRRLLIHVFLLASPFILLTGPCILHAQIAPQMNECAAIDDDEARLQCYDAAAGRTKTAPKNIECSQTLPVDVTKPADKTKEKPVITGETVLARQWDLDEDSRARRFVIRPYRPNYVLPIAYNNSPNYDSDLDNDPNSKAQHTEVKFQLSFKVKLWEDIFGKDIDLWFAYTQLAFWQLYNSAFSSPFRETNYEPELLLNFRTDYDFLGLKGKMIALGLNHQSNGRAEPLSRSWNRVMADFGFERGPFNFFLKTWYRIPEKAADDDNPDILKYMGYFELWSYYFWNNNRFGMMVRNNFRSENKGAVQLEWTFPIIERISGYVQYFNGYGESLIDYDHNVNRFSIGFMLTDWF